MAMNKPPIDELKAKMDGNPYKLCVVVSKRAKDLLKTIPAELEKSDKKEISIAAEEVFEGKIVASDDLNNN